MVPLTLCWLLASALDVRGGRGETLLGVTKCTGPSGRSLPWPRSCYKGPQFHRKAQFPRAYLIAIVLLPLWLPRCSWTWTIYHHASGRLYSPTQGSHAHLSYRHAL